MDAISSMEFDYVASGHYANVVHPKAADQMDKPSVLELSKDMVHILETFFHSYHFPLYLVKLQVFPCNEMDLSNEFCFVMLRFMFLHMLL